MGLAEAAGAGGVNARAVAALLPAPGGARAPGRRALRGLSWAAPFHAALLAGALVLWGLSLPGIELDSVAGLGLVNALPVPYFFAFALLQAGFGLALTARPVPRLIVGVYIVALIAVLHGTTPLLYDEPRYGWTYKHLGVIDLIATTGTVDRSIDIYNSWPGLFALSAWISELTGVAPIRYAEWSQVFFNLLNVVVIQYALRGLTSDERVVYAATWLFLLANWVGQDYLAPQPLGFLLSMMILGLCLRCAPPIRGHRREPASRAPSLSPRAALLVGGLCYLGLVVTHQLSPVMVIVTVSGLALFVRRIPLWIPVAMGLVELWWVALAWPHIEHHFELLSFDPFSRPGGSLDRSAGLPGLEFVTWAMYALGAVVALLALLGWIRRRRAGCWDTPAMIVAVGPPVVMLLQSYGGEAILRAYLFSLPWLCFFAAAACLPARASRLPTWMRSWRLIMASAVMAPLLLVSYFGLELMNRMDPADVRAATWYEHHAPRGSLMLFVSPNFPNRLTARYAQLHIPGSTYAPVLTDEPGVRRGGLGPEDVRAVKRLLNENGVPHSYVVLSPSEERYARLYGLLPHGSLAGLERGLVASGDFRLAYSSARARIFKYRPPDKRRRGGGSGP
jgi:hypothetical protein